MTAIGADELDVLLDDLVMMRLADQDMAGAVKVFDLLLVIADGALTAADVPDHARLSVFGWVMWKFLVGARDHEVIGPLIEVEHATGIEATHG